jgi:hypothetical protein
VVYCFTDPKIQKSIDKPLTSAYIKDPELGTVLSKKLQKETNGKVASEVTG